MEYTYHLINKDISHEVTNYWNYMLHLITRIFIDICVDRSLSTAPLSTHGWNDVVSARAGTPPAIHDNAVPINWHLGINEASCGNTTRFRILNLNIGRSIEAFQYVDVGTLKCTKGL